jgi:hypothetical protein
MKKPLKMFMSDEVEDPTTCPICGTKLPKPEHRTYVVSVKDKGETDAFMMGCDGGYFCPKCPTVVLNSQMFEDILYAGVQSRNFKYSVIGLADLDSILEEKKNIPLGDDDNPIPLIKFEYVKKGPPKQKQDTIGRNDPCPCGSGKKYKKCCMGKDNTQ